VISTARLNLEGLYVDGRQQARIGGTTMDVTFDELLMDVNERRITSGRIIFDEAFALALTIDGDTPTFRAVPADIANAPARGVYFELGGAVVVDSAGIKTSGSATASLLFGDMQYGNAEVVFSDNFALGLVPFEVRTGRADFYYDDVMVAWLDQSGFHPLISGLAEEMLPDRLPLPTLQIAWLTLRDQNGQLLVDIQEPGDGTILLQSRQGSPLELVIPLLDPSNPPVLAGVELNNVVISATPGNMTVQSGSIDVLLPEDDPLTDRLHELGLPLKLREIAYGVTQESPDQAALRLLGDLRLFDRIIEGATDLAFTVFDDGLIMADLDLQNLGVSIPLLDFTDKLQLELDAINGYVTLPALTGGSVNIDLEIDGNFTINAASPAAASSAITLQLKPGHTSLQRFDPIVLPEPYPIDLGGFSFILNEMRSLPVFEYDRINGWDITVDLDMDLRVNLADGEFFQLPMSGVLLGNDGFTIPAQNISSSSIPGLSLPTFDLAGFSFKPLALRTQAGISFNWFTGELPTIDPRFDFEVQLPELPGINPPDGLTFVDVGFADGLLSGSMSPYNPIGGILIPLGPPQFDPPVIRVDELTGALETVDVDGIISQVVNLEVSGVLHELPFFDNPDNSCTIGGTYTLRIVEGSAFEGTVANVTPCGSKTYGPLTLSAGSSSLLLAFDGDRQQASLQGSFTASVPSPVQNAPDIEADGTLTVDLIAATITDGQLAINEPFLLPIPASATEPLLLFTVNSALLNRDGFRINGAGTLKAGDASVNATFDNLLLGLPDFGIRDGRTVIAGSFGVDLTLSPLKATVTAANAPYSAADMLRFTASADVVLDSLGLNYTGSGSAGLIFQGETYASLRAEFEDNFTFRTSVPRVRRGQALFYLDTAQPGDDPLAILDEYGIRIGGGLLAALPDTIGLPSKDIAYVVIKDAQGDLLVNLESGAQGGYLLQTGTTPLPVVFPALAAPDGTMPEVGVTFSLTTDDMYTPNGGTLSVHTALDLEPWTGLPLRLDSLGLDLANTGQLAARLSLDLPEAFGDHTARGTVQLNSNGFAQAAFEIGNHSESYDQGITPFYERELVSALTGSQQDETFTVSLFGAQLNFGQSNSLRISGTLQSSLITGESDQPFPLFYSAGYSNGNWDFALEDSGYSPVIRLGLATLEFDEHNPFSLTLDQERFGISMNGRVSFEEFLNEPVEFSFADLQVGVEQLPDNPRLYFSMGAASASLPEQTFSLFEDALVVTLINPALAIRGRTITASVDMGELTLLGKTIDYNNLSVDTDGNFNIGAIETDDIQIIQQYLVLKQLGLSYTGDEGLRMMTTFGVFVPDPIDYSTDITITVGRDAQNKVTVTSNNSLACPMDNTFNLGASVAFKLDCVDVDIDPRAISETGIYVAGRVMINDVNRISLGEAGDIRNKPGIAIKGGQPIKYNVTGNGSFDFSYSFFILNMGVNSTASSDDRFRIVLNGQAGLDIAGVSGTAGFKDMIITRNGIEDIGKFDGTASFTLMNIATLELGSFVHEKNDDGFDISITEATNEKPGELQQRAGQQTPAKNLSVTELLCFGPCTDFGGGGSTALSLSLGGSNSGGGGAFSGSLEQVLFYRTTEGNITLYIDGFEASIGERFNLFAALHYEGQGDNGMKLRVAGGGNFNAGGQEVGAVVAGVFSNVNNELSFGIFAAVRSDVGIPIVPGIVDLTGFGGGFFVKASRDDIKFATDAINAFRGTELGDRQITAIDPGKYANKPLTVMLYAEVGIGGAGGINILKGKTFFAITGSSFYMDATGTMLGLDGSKLAGLRMMAGMALDITWSPDFYLAGNIWADVQIPLILKGGTIGQGIEFFAGKHNGQTLWGVMGGVEVSVFSGLISGSASILAANKGFMLEASLGLDFLNQIPIISASGSMSGAIWYIRGVEYPFGAYVTAEISIKALITVSAELRAAFVTTRSGGFEFFAMGKGCIDLLFDEACLAGWILIGTSKFDFGIGEGKHADLVRKAQQQRDQFAAEIEETRRMLEDLKEAAMAVPPFEGGLITAQDARKAGHHLYQSAYNLRLQWASLIRTNEGLGAYTIPTILDQMLSQVVEASRTYQQTLEQQEATSTQAALDEITFWVNKVQEVAEETLERIGRGNELAQIYLTESTQALDDMYDVMAQSPIRRFNTPPPPSQGNITEPDFDVDTDASASHHTSGAQTLEAVEALDEQIRAAIDAIEDNLLTMNRVLATQIGIPQVYYDPFTRSYQTSGEFSMTPSVNTVSELYANAISAVRNYYARQANKQWADVVWAEGRRSWINSRTSQINTAMNALLTYLQNAHANRQSNPGAFSTQRIMMTERVNILENLKNERSPGQHNAYSVPSGPVKTMFDGLGEASVTWDNIRNIDIQNYWYTMHESGLLSYARATARSVNNELVSQQSGLLSNLTGPLLNQTRGIERFYNLKSNILANLYSILDSYVHTRSLVAEPDEITLGYQQRLSEIADILQPPVLSQITVDPRRTSGTFFNTTAIQWSASHPVKIEEVSADLQEYETETDVLTGVSGYLTIGNPDSYTYSTYKSSFEYNNILNPSAGYNTKRLNIGLRVRGPGGNVAFRRAIFDVDVGEGGLTTQANQNILTTDTTPPESIMLNLDSFYNNYITLGSYGQRIQRFMTNNPSSIELHILSYDPESGISRFEYAVGTTRGGTDVVEWTELPGAIELWTNENAPAFMIKGRTRILNMQPGRAHYVSVRSYNGAGMVSTINQQSHPVIYDDTPPTMPGQVYQALIVPLYILSGPPPVNDVVQTAPRTYWPGSEFINNWNQPSTPKIIKASWAASEDLQSGIHHYEYAVSRYAEIRQSDFDEPFTTSDLTATVQSGSFPHSDVTFNFGDERYIHVRAVNKAGTAGQARTFGPIPVKDPNGPTKPEVNAAKMQDFIRLYLSEGAWDPETKLKGYQFAVGTTPGGTDVKNWSPAGNVDFEYTDVQFYNYISKYRTSINGAPAPYLDIPLSDPSKPASSTFPVGPMLYFSLRGVNNQDMPSGYSVSGPINLDTTPPLTPTITMSNPSGNWLYAKVENIHDPESGFLKVEYKLERKVVSSTGLVNWYTVTGYDWITRINYTTPRMVASTANIYADIPSGISLNDIRIKVRITNGAHLQGVTTKNYYVPTYNLTSPINNYNYNF
jgi:large repetitive protein